MARDLEEENYYVSHGGQVPVKWTAPEVNIYMLIVCTVVAIMSRIIPYNAMFLYRLIR